MKRYFSNKHKLYGLKVESSVAYPGYCVDLSPHFPAATSDLTIFLSQLPKHKEMVRKTEEDLRIEDSGEGSESYQNYWAILTDKGYQGSSNYIRTIHPKKKPIGSELTREDIQRNARISSDRVLVENYFGRVCSLWKISRSTYKWNQEAYDMITRLTFALTNFHVSLMELRESDGDFYRAALAKYYATGEERVQSRASFQAAYRRRRAARVRAERMNQERVGRRQLIRDVNSQQLYPPYCALGFSAFTTK
jgi:hypothetical protein